MKFRGATLHVGADAEVGQEGCAPQPVWFGALSPDARAGGLCQAAAGRRAAPQLRGWLKGSQRCTDKNRGTGQDDRAGGYLADVKLQASHVPFDRFHLLELKGRVSETLPSPASPVFSPEAPEMVNTPPLLSWLLF